MRFCSQATSHPLLQSLGSSPPWFIREPLAVGDKAGLETTPSRALGVRHTPRHLPSNYNTLKVPRLGLTHNSYLLLQSSTCQELCRAPYTHPIIFLLPSTRPFADVASPRLRRGRDRGSERSRTFPRLTQLLQSTVTVSSGRPDLRCDTSYTLVDL